MKVNNETNEVSYCSRLTKHPWPSTASLTIASYSATVGYVAWGLYKYLTSIIFSTSSGLFKLPVVNQSRHRLRFAVPIGLWMPQEVADQFILIPDCFLHRRLRTGFLRLLQPSADLSRKCQLLTTMICCHKQYVLVGYFLLFYSTKPLGQPVEPTWELNYIAFLGSWTQL